MQRNEQDKRKTMIIYIDDTTYASIGGEIIRLSEENNNNKQKLIQLEKRMQNQLYIHKSANKPGGEWIPEKRIERQEGRWESYSCQCRRQEYCSCPTQTYVTYTDYEIIPGHFVSTPDENRRKDALTQYESLKNEYEILQCQFKAKQNEIKILEDKCVEIDLVGCQEMNKHLNSFKDCDRNITKLTINSFPILLAFIKEENKFQNIDMNFEIDLSNQNIYYLSIFNLVNTIISLGRISNVRFNINLSNNNIAVQKNIEKITQLLLSPKRPIWINIQFNDKLNIGLPNSCGLFSAIEANDFQAVKNILLEGPGEGKSWDCIDGDSALHLAAKKGNKDIIGLLIDYKFPLNQENKNKKTPIEICNGKNNFKIEKYIAAKIQTDLDDTYRYGSVLLNVILKDDLETAKILLKAGAGNNKDWNQGGYFALHIALMKEPTNPEMVELLINYNFPLNRQNNNYVMPANLLEKKAYKFSGPDKFTLIWVKWLATEYSSANEINKLCYQKHMQKVIDYVLRYDRIPKDISFEIANFCFCNPSKNNDNYLNSILFFTLAEDDSQKDADMGKSIQPAIRECKNLSYFALLNYQDDINNFDLTKINIENIKDILGDKFSSSLQSSGLIQKLESRAHFPCINFELAKLYLSIGDHKKLFQCLDGDSKNQKISAMIFLAVKCFKVNNINIQKNPSYFFGNSADVNRLNVYKMLLNDDNKSVIDKTLILLALFSCNDTTIFADKGISDLKKQFASLLSFDNPTQARECYTKLIRILFPSDYNSKRDALNDAIGEIIKLANSDKVYSKNDVDKKFEMIMQKVENTNKNKLG